MQEIPNKWPNSGNPIETNMEGPIQICEIDINATINTNSDNNGNNNNDTNLFHLCKDNQNNLNENDGCNDVCVNNGISVNIKKKKKMASIYEIPIDTLHTICSFLEMKSLFCLKKSCKFMFGIGSNRASFYQLGNGLFRDGDTKWLRLLFEMFMKHELDIEIENTIDKNKSKQENEKDNYKHEHEEKKQRQGRGRGQRRQLVTRAQECPIPDHSIDSQRQPLLISGIDDGNTPILRQTIEIKKEKEITKVANRSQPVIEIDNAYEKQQQSIDQAKNASNSVENTSIRNHKTKTDEIEIENENENDNVYADENKIDISSEEDNSWNSNDSYDFSDLTVRSLDRFGFCKKLLINLNCLRSILRSQKLEKLLIRNFSKFTKLEKLMIYSTSTQLSVESLIGQHMFSKQKHLKLFAMNECESTQAQLYLTNNILNNLIDYDYKSKLHYLNVFSIVVVSFERLFFVCKDFKNIKVLNLATSSSEASFHDKLKWSIHDSNDPLFNVNRYPAEFSSIIMCLTHFVFFSLFLFVFCFCWVWFVFYHIAISICN